MRPFIYSVLGLTTVCAMFFSCRHEPSIPDQQVSFNNEVLPIINANCSHAGCHAQSDEKPIFQYSDLVHDNMVVPGDPYASEIYTRICSQRKDEVMPVPPVPPLQEEQIMTIFIWIKQGAQNN